MNPIIIEPTNLDGQCLRCGKCCQNPLLFVIEQSEYHDFVKWMDGYGCEATRGIGGVDSCFIVTLPLKCRHLSVAADGVATCAIHDERPDICRRYYCGEGGDGSCPKGG